MIRKMNLNEIDEVSKIWLQSNLEAHDFIDKKYWLNNLPEVKRQFETADIWVYVKDEVIQGFVGLQDDFIAGIFIKKENRHQGIGKQLLEFLKSDHSELTLEVYDKNTSATQFYLHNDFKIIETGMDEANQEIEHKMIWTK